VSVRTSPGSPSQTIAALVRRQECSPSRWRSRQLYETFSLPPTNHFANGGFQSSTFFQGLNQVTCSRAIFAQNRWGSRAPCARSALVAFAVQLARFANSAGGRNTRFSRSSDSMSAILA
jgi:hypothetical protein